MRISKTVSNHIVASIGLVLAAAGCQQAAKTVATPSESATPASTKVAVKAPVKMTPSQKQGVDILKALNANPALKNHAISVGTGQNTVYLNGKVRSAAQKQTAERIVRQQAKGHKIVNDLTVGAP